MDKKSRLRGVHVTAKQKKKLIELITSHPELISCKVTQDFNYRDSQKLWITIANECNSIPGARKTWRQWRKTWQDLRSKTKKRHAENNGELPSSVILLTQAEQEALGIKDVVSTTSCQESTDSVDSKPLAHIGHLEDIDQDNFNNIDVNLSFSDTSDPPDKKYPMKSNKLSDKSKCKDYIEETEHSNCIFNCNTLAKQELRKIHLKEDYLNFKKSYLREKLKLLKEQTEALKSIAKELCNK